MNPKLLKQLRDETGASFLLCKQALESTNDDYQKSLAYIDEHQVKEKGNDRVASKGIVVVYEKDNDAILFEVNGETDFLVKNPHFIDFIERIKEPLILSDIANPKQALSLMIGDKSISELVTQLSGLTKENLNFRRFYRVRKSDKQSFGTYTHNQGRIASLVVLNEQKKDIANTLALQVVANQAQYLSYDLIDPDTINYEKFMYEKEHQNFDENLFIKHVKSISLLDQPYFKNPNLTVNQFLKENNASVVDFYKFELGQGIDNKLNCRLDIPCDGSKITVMPIY
ncbi:MAG: translation elongation factor Ts [Acholeplasmataceae bacterium]